MKQFVAALISDTQGQTDEQALISIVGAAVFFSLEIYSVAWHGQNFDPFGFGAGIGALLGATSAGFGLRARWTPPSVDFQGGNQDNNQDSNIDIDPVTGRFIGEPHASLSG